MKSARSSECRPSTLMSSTCLVWAVAVTGGTAEPDDGSLLQATTIRSSPVAAAIVNILTKRAFIVLLFGKTGSDSLFAHHEHDERLHRKRLLFRPRRPGGIVGQVLRSWQVDLLTCRIERHRL